MAEITSKQNRVKSSQVFGDYLVMMIALCCVSVAFYSERSLAVVAVSVLAAVVTDIVMSAIAGKKFKLKDPSSIFTGAAIAFMMPAGIALYIPAIASAFAVAVVKVPFGGGLKAPFVPAAAGFAFASVCFKEQVFDYSAFASGKAFGPVSLGSLLKNSNSVYIGVSNIFDIIGGNVAGPMGTGCALLMAGCCVYLFVRRRKALIATFGFVVSCAVFTAILPRANAGILTNILLELTSGSLLFGAVFLLTDYATLPKGGVNKLIYGIVCGIFCMAMRRVGSYEETVCFAILLANGTRPLFDSALDALYKAKKPSAKKGGAR